MDTDLQYVNTTLVWTVYICMHVSEIEYDLYITQKTNYVYQKYLTLWIYVTLYGQHYWDEVECWLHISNFWISQILKSHDLKSSDDCTNVRWMGVAHLGSTDIWHSVHTSTVSDFKKYSVND